MAKAKLKKDAIKFSKVVNDAVATIYNTFPFVFTKPKAVKMLKDDYLPFNNLEHHLKITFKELNSTPDLYLL